MKTETQTREAQGVKDVNEIEVKNETLVNEKIPTEEETKRKQGISAKTLSAFNKTVLKIEEEKLLDDNKIKELKNLLEEVTNNWLKKNLWSFK